MLLNKIDLAAAGAWRASIWDSAVALSLKTGEGVPEVRTSLARCSAAPHPCPRGRCGGARPVMVTNIRHEACSAGPRSHPPDHGRR